MTSYLVQAACTVSSVVAGLISAGFWIASTLVPTPKFDNMDAFDADSALLAKAARRNAWAAGFAAIAVATQAIVQLAAVLG